ncbi:MAG: helix-turn-helix transcriptional regulator [Litoreibacter sp.]|uniref:AraC family transcriptional regulator n=1 Tax=Litoreibacter sp. TaxID=1969459 RepID=UPI0032989BF9
MGTSAADPIQQIGRAVVILSKDYAPEHCTELHQHSRAQFLFAKTGTMRARTALGSWIVPPGYGLLIPAHAEHQIEMFGMVALRSAYIHTAALPMRHQTRCSVIHVSPLLFACIDRLSAEPAEYDLGGIAGHIAAIIITEIADTPPSAMALPFPTAPKLGPLVRAMLNDPSDPRSIDDWANELAMSRRSFTRLFRSETGMSFDQWRQRRRFQAASELMALKMPMPQIAAEVGYGSVSALKAMLAKFE